MREKKSLASLPGSFFIFHHMIAANVSIQDFNGVYEEQPFMMELKAASRLSPIENNAIKWFDCSKISGTDCYCDDEAKEILCEQIKRVCSLLNRSNRGIHFFDNGNYHYMSKLWTDQVQKDFDLVVFDHHPDMQPPRFEGILSCGGWIKEVLDSNPHAQRVLIIGVADHLIDEIKNEPSAEFSRYADRVKFIAESELLKASDAGSPTEIPADHLRAKNIYISIDKDALAITEAVTNWDQGSLTFVQMEQVLRQLFRDYNILGVDICGERAQEQDYSDGIDAGQADTKNNVLNQKLFKLLQVLYAQQ